MKETLFNELKGAMNDPNDELLKIGEFRMGLTGQRQLYHIAVTNSAVLSILAKYTGVVFTQNNEPTFELDTYQRTATASADCVVAINDKYQLKEIYADANTGIECNIDELHWSLCQILRIYSGIDGSEAKIIGHTSMLPSTLEAMSIYSKGIIFDGLPTLDSLTEYQLVCSEAININAIVAKYPALTKILGFYSDIKGTIDTIPTSTTITTLRLEQRGDLPHYISGTIEHLGTWTALTTLNISGTSISGTLEDFCTAQITAGRTSGSITFTGNGIVTYNNVAVPKGTSKTITFSNGSYTIS